MNSEAAWRPWMLAEYGIQPWQVRDYTSTQLRQLRGWLDERDARDGVTADGIT